MNLALGRHVPRPDLSQYLAAGIPATVIVGLAGLSAGFFAWYGVLLRGGEGWLRLEATFTAAVLLGPALALFLWSWYARYFARHTDIAYEAALRWDTIPWATLFLFWGALAGPTGLGSSGRAAAIAVSAFCIAKIAIAARFNETVRDVLMTFVVTRISIIIIAELASVIVGQRPGVHFAASNISLLAVWGRWDAEHYLGIASSGYSGTEPAFFPLYPLAIRLVGSLIHSHLIAGLIISNVASFFGLLYFYRLVEHEYNRHVAHRATFYVSIFPTAIFFSAVYTESLFLCLTVASFYYIRERRWLMAGVMGYFAALTRVEGILLAVPFFIEWMLVLRGQTKDLWKWPLTTLVKPALGLLAIPLGLATYMAYLWILRGDPLYFSHVQAHWGRYLAPPWMSVVHSVWLVFGNVTPQAVANQIFELAATALMIGTLVVGFRRLRASYTWYMALSILVPMSTASLMSMPRFALVLFPMFTLFGLWGAKSHVNNLIVAFSLPLLGLFTVLFADWYWVA